MTEPALHSYHPGPSVCSKADGAQRSQQGKNTLTRPAKRGTCPKLLCTFGDLQTENSTLWALIQLEKYSKSLADIKTPEPRKEE